MALEDNKYDHLVELGDSDYEIVDGEPNIKGWDVKDTTGHTIGDVDELLFDPQSRQVRYLVIDLDGNQLGIDEDKKVLVPIGVAELYNDGHAQDDANEVEADNDAEERVDIASDSDYETDDDNDDDEVYSPYNDGDVVIVAATADQLSRLPAYVKGDVTPENESMIRDIFSDLGAAGLAAGASAYNKDDFYSHDHFNENKFYNRKLPVIEENLEVGKQEVETGGARLTSRIVERPVEESINLREEHVNVERTPVNRPVDATDSDLFKEEEFELTEHAEVPVVAKEARVVEEVSLNKEVEDKEVTIRDTVRNTEVDIEKTSGEDDKSDDFTNRHTGIL